MTLRRSPSQFLGAFGTGTLVAGVLAGLSPGFITDPSRCTIILSRNTPGGTLGFLSAPVADRSMITTTFSIASSNVADVSSVNWMAIPKNGGNGSAEFTNQATLRRSPSGLNVTTGYSTLVAGTKTVTGIAMGPNARVFVMATTLSGTTGKLSVPSATVNPTAGTFVINSSSATDTSVVGYVVVDEPLRFSPSGPIFSQSTGTLVGGTHTFAGMDPANKGDELLVLASAMGLATPGNLSAPYGSIVYRANGSITITSSAGGDTSFLEVAAF